MGRWKGVRLNVRTSTDAPIELYDLSIDPGEKNNIASGHADIVSRIAAIMKDAHRPNKDWPLLAGE
jgi:hypothetical protein